MNQSKVIDFESREHLIEKAGSYIESVELFLKERDRAVPLLLKVLKYADYNFKQKAILFLGDFAREEVAWPLYQILIDPEENKEFRRFATIQLSIIFPFLEDPQPLIDYLLENLKSPDPELRTNAAFALGWEGNIKIAIPLIELLYDSDVQVQQSAVNALTNLRDDRLFNLLVERLEHGSLEQRRCILFNIWRFSSKRKEVVRVYLRYLEHENDDLRYDALALLGSVSEAAEHIAEYRRCLNDEVPHIRALALERLYEAGGDDLPGLKEEIENMLSDHSMEVKRVAIKILKKLNRDSGILKDVKKEDSL